MHDLPNPRRRRIDAMRRQQLVVGAEVRRGKADGPPALVAQHHGAVEEVLMPEQRPGFIQTPFADEAPDPRAADDEILVADRIDFLRLEAVPAAKGPQPREIAGTIVSEKKIRAHPHFADAKPVDENRPNESFRIPARELRCEADDRRALHAGIRYGFQLLFLRHQQRGRLVWSDDPRRMGIESHHDRRGAALAGHSLDPVENLAMPAVHAVEVAQGEDRVRPASRSHVLREMDYVHEKGLTAEYAEIAEHVFSAAFAISAVIRRPRARAHHKPTPRQAAVARRFPRVRDRGRYA